MELVAGFDGGGGQSHHAAHGAKLDLTYAAHSARPVPEALGSAETRVLEPARGGRRWDPREKARITAESFEPGANISAVARRNGVSLGLLHY